ncbi:methionine gamma-lyase [Alkalihalobacillus hwajinpoensis]|uniref:methionine gamma-lyase n=1 Tax=Guptibacillus hwajinpoensis TaxID=208199 RepID=UPI001883FFC2|nr:methionine gamma-lyase [Pseudalkalibacillus hwajinpoensis]MBF0706220.1 methionine gamma-lyase [Pseudalkalibacillus hwajinpoensis]
MEVYLAILLQGVITLTGKHRFETKTIHDGYESKSHHNSLASPIYQTSTFTFETAEAGERRFAGEEPGYIYSRLGNPTVRMLEERIASLENAEAGLAFGSGMAAVSAVLLNLVKTGDHILCSEGVYGCTFGLLKMLEEKFSVEHDLLPLDSVEQLQKAIRPNTTVIYIETPINPTLKLIDLEMVSTVAKEKGIKVVVDNTFSTPYLQRPLEFGCDIVLHSATKYISGHGDVVAGLVAGDQETISSIAKSTQKDIGGILSPFDAWLLLRGLKTLPIRMDRHSSNARQIMKKLAEHPAITNVMYPGMEESSSYAIAQKQMKSSGGLISFEIAGEKKESQAFMNRLNMIKIAVSLGDAETLIQHPATMTHAVVPEEERLRMGISETLIRLSVGLEAWEDIWEDILQALEN